MAKDLSSRIIDLEAEEQRLTVRLGAVRGSLEECYQQMKERRAASLKGPQQLQQVIDAWNRREVQP